MKINLNQIDPVDDGFTRLDNNNIESQVSSVSAYFRDIKTELISNIEKADAVFGCIAWLSNSEIISALQSRKNFSIVVSEKSCNTSLKTLSKHKNWIKLSSLANDQNHFYTLINQTVPGVNKVSAEDTILPIRRLIPNQIGGHKESEKPLDYQPLMHNKFLVFAKIVFAKDELQNFSNAYYAGQLGADSMAETEYMQCWGSAIIKPYAVWTGSYNFSSSAESHLENAVLIHNAEVAHKYFCEFSQIYLLSI